MSDETASSKPGAKKKRRKKKSASAKSEARSAQPATEPENKGTGSEGTERKGMDPARRNLLIGLAAGVVVGAGGGFYGGQLYGKSQRRPRRERKPIPPAHIKLHAWSARKGPAAAKVTVVEFTDFQ